MPSPTRWPNGLTNRSATHVLNSLPIPDPTKHIVFHEDFISVTASASGVTGWHVDQVGSGTALTGTDGYGGVATVETGNMALDNIGYQWATNTTVHEFLKVQAGKKAWMRIRFKTEDADKDVFYIGMHIEADDVLTTEPSDQFVFRSTVAAPDTITFAAGKTNTTEVVATLGTMADDTWVILTAYYDGASTVYVWQESADGTVTATGSATVTSSTPGDLLPDVNLTVGFTVHCTDTGADLMTLDYITIIIER